MFVLGGVQGQALGSLWHMVHCTWPLHRGWRLVGLVQIPGGLELIRVEMSVIGACVRKCSSQCLKIGLIRHIKLSSKNQFP